MPAYKSHTGENLENIIIEINIVVENKLHYYGSLKTKHNIFSRIRVFRVIASNGITIYCITILLKKIVGIIK